MHEFPTRASSGPGWFAVLFLSLSCSLASVGLFYWALLHGYLPAIAPAQAANTDSPSLVKVPELTGLPVSAAGELLEARGLRLLVREERPDVAAPKGGIARQDPLMGSSLARGAEVSVVVSLGAPESVVLPDLHGESLESARRTLASLGLEVGPVAGPEDGVIKATQPAGGQALTQGAMVGLSLEPAGVEVPKLVGLSLRRAKAELEQAGFTLGKVRIRFDEMRAAGLVLEQSIAPGEKAEKGARIDLVRNEDD